jgi:class 3 adenylate cyclase
VRFSRLAAVALAANRPGGFAQGALQANLDTTAPPCNVMVCDLVDSTGIAAKLDAEEWRDLVGGYLDAASTAVAEMGGHVANKLGDGLLAFFGYPVAQENDAECAVRAALSIQRARSPSSIARMPAAVSRNWPPASGSTPAPRWWTRPARFMATSPMWRRGCRRWLSPALC